MRNFARDMKKRVGFAEQWIHLIMECISTVIINGENHGYIKPCSGLCHGDPLSPYLFLICAEGFTSLLKHAEAQGSISGNKVASRGLICSSPMIVFYLLRQMKLNVLLLERF